jgi:hypothetical protein
MTRVLTNEDINGGWIIVREGRFRYVVQQTSLLGVRSVWSEYLATEVQW